MLYRALHARRPFAWSGALRLVRGEPTLFFEETVHNEVRRAGAFCVGPALPWSGAPFLEAGCRLLAPAHTLFTPAAHLRGDVTAGAGPAQRLAAGAGCAPAARWTCRTCPVPRPTATTVVFATDLTAGWLAVTNPRLDLTFGLNWDPASSNALPSGMPYGGCEAMPLRGIYALGIEPWTAPHNLEQALAAGDAVELAGGASLSTTLHATLSRGPWPSRRRN